jgi:molybdate transport system substrate-binding protein
VALVSRRAALLCALSSLAALATASCRKKDPDTLVVFAASSTADALTEIGAGYEARTGRKVRFTFGGSSELARQLESGAQADVFLSADVEKMDALARAGKVVGASRRDLLSNVLVVVVPKDSATVLARASDLASLKKIATGETTTVPIGIYARRWLESAGAWEAVKPNIVATIDVRAALAAVETETVDAAIVYKTDALVSTRVRIALEVPAGEGPEIAYPIAALVGGQEAAAAAFLDELRGTDARAVFTRRGFIVR